MTEPVTKKEVEEIVDKALDRDLGAWAGQLQQQMKQDKEELKAELLDAMDERLEKKIEAAGDIFIEKIDNKIAHYVEIQADQHLGAKHDEVDGIKTKVDDHEERITKIEDKVAV